MMKHIFTLFLNQKRRYGGMLAEQMLVFFVLLFCFVVVGEKIAQYFSPGVLIRRIRLTVCYFPFHPRNIFRLRKCSKKWIVLLKRFENLRL